MPRPLDPHLPRCPEHSNSRVRRHGAYGLSRPSSRVTCVHARTRFLCVLPGGKRHTFSSGRAMPRTGPCARCDRAFSDIDGPEAPRKFMHIVPDIARALLLVGQGTYYRTAGQRVRQMSKVIRWDEKRKRSWPLDGGKDWGLVADWVEMYAHEVTEPDD